MLMQQSEIQTADVYNAGEAIKYILTIWNEIKRL